MDMQYSSCKSGEERQTDGVACAYGSATASAVQSHLWCVQVGTAVQSHLWCVQVGTAVQSHLRCVQVGTAVQSHLRCVQVGTLLPPPGRAEAAADLVTALEVWEGHTVRWRVLPRCFCRLEMLSRWALPAWLPPSRLQACCSAACLRSPASMDSATWGEAVCWVAIRQRL
jgi:hypothetical protein